MNEDIADLLGLMAYYIKRVKESLDNQQVSLARWQINELQETLTALHVVLSHAEA